MNKKGFSPLEKGIGIFILLVFLIVAALAAFGPQGMLTTLADKIQIFKQFLPQRLPSEPKAEIPVPASVEGGFNSLVYVFEKSVASQKTDCLAYFPKLPDLQGFKINILKGTDYINFQIEDPNGRIARTRQIKVVNLGHAHWIGSRIIPYRPDYSYYTSPIDKISIKSNTAIDVNSKEYKLIETSNRTHVINLLLISNSIPYMLSADGEVSSKLASILPTGASPMELCFQNSCEFIRDCNSMKNNDKCDSNPCNLMCTWNKGNCDICDSIKDCSGYKDYYGCSRHNCGQDCIWIRTGEGLLPSSLSAGNCISAQGLSCASYKSKEQCEINPYLDTIEDKCAWVDYTLSFSNDQCISCKDKKCENYDYTQCVSNPCKLTTPCKWTGITRVTGSCVEESATATTAPAATPTQTPKQEPLASMPASGEEIIPVSETPSAQPMPTPFPEEVPIEQLIPPEETTIGQGTPPKYEQDNAELIEKLKKLPAGEILEVKTFWKGRTEMDIFKVLTRTVGVSWQVSIVIGDQETRLDCKPQWWNPGYLLEVDKLKTTFSETLKSCDY